MGPIYFDHSFVREVRDEMQEALQAVAERHHLHVEVGRARFTPNSATFEVQLALKDSSGKALTREAEMFKLLAPRVGLSADDLGRTFTYGGEQYTIKGWLLKNRKYPVLVERADGRQIKMPVEAVLGSLAVQPR